MKWLWLLLSDPATALDWHDQRSPGQLDHGKVIPDCVLFLLLLVQVIVSFHNWSLPPALWGVIDLSAAFGSMSWRAFLNKSSFAVTEQSYTGPPLTRDISPDAAP